MKDLVVNWYGLPILRPSRFMWLEHRKVYRDQGRSLGWIRMGDTLGRPISPALIFPRLMRVAALSRSQNSTLAYEKRRARNRLKVFGQIKISLSWNRGTS